MKRQQILVTGGLGYFGSNVVVELLQNRYDVTIEDNFSNSEEFIIDRIENITGHQPRLYKADICDPSELNSVFTEIKFDAVVHLAAFKYVGESVNQPLKYFNNKLCSLINLLGSMERYAVNNLISSSSATVYGVPEMLYHNEILNSPIIS